MTDEDRRRAARDRRVLLPRPGGRRTNDPPAQDGLVRLDVAARELGVSSKTVKKYCRCEKLRCQQLPSGHWRVFRTSLDAARGELQTGPNHPK